jgi:hypothetical protein
MANNAQPASAGGGGMFGAAQIANAIVGVVQNIEQGKISKAQANYNAAMLEGKAKWIDLQKETEAAQYDRFRGRFIGKSVAAVAGAGLMMSGSPMAVLLDSVTQINIDKAVGQANLEQQKRFTLASADMERVNGKNAMRQAYTNAFSTALNSGSNYALYKSGALDLSQGAKTAGRQ